MWSCLAIVGFGAIVVAWGTGCSPATVAKSPPSARDAATAGETVRYCAGTVTHFDIHDCIFELTPEEQRRRNFSHRLVYKNGRLIRFEVIDGRGHPYEQEDNKTTDIYRYRGEKLAWIEQRGKNGVVRGRLVYSDGGKWVHWLDEKGRPQVRSGERASGLRRRFNTTGRVISYSYVDTSGVPALSSDGRYEVRVKRNAIGGIVEQAYFDPRGAPMFDKYGVHREVNTLNERGQSTRVQYFDERGRPTLNSDGVHTRVFVLDDVGNLASELCFGIKGEPVRSSLDEAASFRIRRDAHGSEVFREYFDESARPTFNVWGYVTRTKDLDDLGRVVRFSFYGLKGEPIRLPENGHSIKELTLDDRGNAIVERYFGTDGSPILAWEGYHRVVKEYDQRDNQARGIFLDIQGRPILTDLHYASWRNEYDGDRLTATTYFDTRGYPVDKGWGYARKTRRYDSAGAEAGLSYFDAAGREVWPPKQCGTYADADIAQFHQLFSQVVVCNTENVPGQVRLSVTFKDQRLHSIAMIGFVDPALRECLERELEAALPPPSSRACVRFPILIEFTDIIKFSPALAPKDEVFNTWPYGTRGRIVSHQSSSQAFVLGDERVRELVLGTALLRL